MAYTYSKIATVTVGSGGASSIDFLAIPQNYTDLLLKISSRSNRADTTDNILISFNGISTSFTYRYLQGSGSAAASGNGTLNYNGTLDGTNATANTFGNAEIYIPNYTSSNYKSISSDSVDENNATAAYATFTATLWSNSSAINFISIKPHVGTLLAQYSSATLYGIKAEV